MLRLKLFSNVFYVLLIFLLTGRFAPAVDMIVAQPGPGPGSDIVYSGDTSIDCGVDCAANSSNAAATPMPDRSALANFPSLFSCSKTCNDQCSVFLAIPDPSCTAACKAWQLPKCWLVSETFNTELRAIGEVLYPAGATLISYKNSSESGFGVPLSERQKQELRPYFKALKYGNLIRDYSALVDQVRIHWDSEMLDDFSEYLIDFALPDHGMWDLAARSLISRLTTGDIWRWRDVHGSPGQTFGLNIYINYRQGEKSFVDETVLLAHEMFHTVQYLERGSSLSAFGGDYFAGLDRGLPGPLQFSYGKNPMEVEAYDFAETVRSGLSSQPPDTWNLELCNESNVDNIWVAFAHYRATLSLVPITYSKGWYLLNKGQCKRPLVNVKTVNGDIVWLYAASQTSMSYLANNFWPSNTVADQMPFCVDFVNAFDLDRPCTGPTEGLVNFGRIAPTREDLGGQLSGTFTKKLKGGTNDTVVNFCNRSPSDAFLAYLVYEQTNGLTSRGWMRVPSLSLPPFQCVSRNFGVQAGNKMHFYAISFPLGEEWPVVKNANDVNICTLPSAPWSFLNINQNPEDDWMTRCLLNNGTIVRAATFTAVPGSMTIDIQPALLKHNLTITKNGPGRVTSSPAGIDCGSVCSASFLTGRVSGITLTAIPSTGFSFSGWTGCTPLVDPKQCLVIMNTDKTVAARFTPNPTLILVKGGSGRGTVTSTPAGINCDIFCNSTFADYTAGTAVTLTASPDSDSTFSGWRGDCTGAGNCSVTMGGSIRNVIATFDALPSSFTLAVDKTGTGLGTVTSSPLGIDCGADCTVDYIRDSSVTLIAAPAGGSVFQGWSGPCSGKDTCTVTMSTARNVTATFAIPTPKSFTVTTLNDGNSGSLRQAISNANANPGDDTIIFQNGLSGTITLTGGQLDITDSLTLNGPGANVLAISGNHSSRVFQIHPGTNGTVTINGLTLKEGYDSGNGGGGIYIDEGTVTINKSTLSDNSAADAGSSGGGGIRNYGSLTVSNSTLSGNTAGPDADGGAIRNSRTSSIAGALTIYNSTLSGNSARFGGGILIDGGVVTVSNSTVSGNSASSGGGIFFNGESGALGLGNSIVAGNAASNDKEIANGSFVFSQGHNLFGENGASGIRAGIILAASDRILAGPISTAISLLADNGGSTRTHLPVKSSPAIDAGDNSLILSGVTTDQRGQPRIQNGTVDIGAVESTGPAGTPKAHTNGLFNPATGTFYLRNSNSAGVADLAFRFGPANAGWIPLVGDWDGNGTDTAGLYSPASGTFYLRNSNSAGVANVAFRFGPANAGWVPLVGDWDGNGTDTVGLFDPVASAFYLRNSHSGGTANVSFRYGPAGKGWAPLMGDWNGNGTDTAGLFDPVTSTFYLKNSNAAGVGDVTFRYGPANAGWTPLAGDWNGPGL